MRRWPHCVNAWARRSVTSRCHTPTTRSRSTTSSRPPRRRRTWRASMASATASACQADALTAMYDATRSAGFGPEVTRRILLGTYVLSAGYYDAYYRRAQEVRTLDHRRISARVFADRRRLALHADDADSGLQIGAISDPYEMYLNDIFTATANLAGVPAISVPIGTGRRTARWAVRSLRRISARQPCSRRPAHSERALGTAASSRRRASPTHDDA